MYENQLGLFFKGFFRGRWKNQILTKTSAKRAVDKTSNPAKNVGTPIKLSRPPSTYNVDNQLIFSLFWQKNTAFYWLEGIGDTWSSSSVPTTFVSDCLKEICKEFPVKVTPAIFTASWYFRIDFGSILSLCLKIRQNFSTLIYIKARKYNPAWNMYR